MDDLEIICDMSQQGLSEIPMEVRHMVNVKMLYLDKNELRCLPEDLFQTLPNLSWLDVRSNKLESLPRGIAHHQCLENLLLQHNSIKMLPKELALVPKLKVLQLSNNPLEYPPARIIEGGIDDILTFFRVEMSKVSEPSSTASDTREVATHSVERSAINLDEMPRTIEARLRDRIRLQRAAYLETKCSKDKVHEVTMSPSKTIIRSFHKNFKVRDVLPTDDKIAAERIKQVWMEKIRELLIDQEKILQEQKSLNALKNWRKDSSRFNKHADAVAAPQAPFDTNSVYNSYMSRTDPSSKIQQMLQEQQPKFLSPNADAVIKDILTQLAKVKESMLDDSDCQEKVEKAKKELEIIIDLHKKIEQFHKSPIL